ncbi:cytochrome c3 family protein [uncultured Jannaschia sp.]|uniref:cytochrome c3 family protein n=1 Tax=uncultured Jannaschia sp. TaxID=293347 RepID=UPI00261841D8|nr:cytochrome c3 family protein [uncultured Jannaschia sp.]
MHVTGRTRLHAARLLLAGALLLIAATFAPAQTLLERLVMPGDLIEGHAELESDCANCHVSFSEEGETALCLDCHTAVDRDITDRRGFHGRRPEVLDQDCRVCHTDHEGRDADIVQLDTAAFDHTDTDFALDGAHEILPCASCHVEGAQFRDAPTMCVDCHIEDQPHEGRLGRDCATCHAPADWTELRPFDHAATDFALVGAHQSIDCMSCHVGEIYDGLPTDCIDCHRIQDVHAGVFGEDCATCHIVEAWTEVRFDHTRDTTFTLVGAHDESGCESCHATNAYETVLATDCYACHAEDDAHAGQLGEACDTCHNPDAWSEDVAFDHDITRFPLLGLHTLVPCESCHLDATFRSADVACASCHSDDDVHEDSLPDQCETCHNPNGWEFWTFDHDTQTDFALTGAHLGLTCEACHSPNAPLEVSQDCASCHADDDVHGGRFGRTCDQCHATDSFEGARLR